MVDYPREGKTLDSVGMYFDEITKAGLLTADQEIHLAQRIEEGDSQAFQQLVDANLRLVVNNAKKYLGKGVDLQDLIQEGNLGLMKAARKYDWRKGYKFSTYATHWIRQSIGRAVADQGRTIRIPVHMVERINHLIRIQKQVMLETGEEPTLSELAEKAKLSEKKVREAFEYTQKMISLETPIGKDEDGFLGDLIPDDHAEKPEKAAVGSFLRDQLNEMMETLSEREQLVLTLRFGLKDNCPKTLEAIGNEMNITRERVRQIESRALTKLRTPSRIKQLTGYLDN